MLVERAIDWKDHQAASDGYLCGRQVARISTPDYDRVTGELGEEQHWYSEGRGAASFPNGFPGGCPSRESAKTAAQAALAAWLERVNDEGNWP